MSKKDEEQKKYEKWWLGKKCFCRSTGEYMTVNKVTLVGPPSFVYGCVFLSFENGPSEEPIIHRGYKPTKKDVSVKN